MAKKKYTQTHTHSDWNEKEFFGLQTNLSTSDNIVQQNKLIAGTTVAYLKAILVRFFWLATL